MVYDRHMERFMMSIWVYDGHMVWFTMSIWYNL